MTFVARQVPADKDDREELRFNTGGDEIPSLLLEDGEAISGDADEIIEYLDARFNERADADEHRERAAEKAA